MKKQLVILACLLLPVAAVQAQQATTLSSSPSAAATTAPESSNAASTSARGHIGATARSQQNRHAKDSACQKAAKDQGLQDLAFKQAVMACMR